MDHILVHAKAYVATVGSAVTAVIALEGDKAPHWLLIVSAVCTGLVTSAVPNKDATPVLATAEAPFVPDLVASADEADPAATA